MSALVSRGLATISKKGGGYTATATDAGRYFHRHGEYPVDSAGGRRAARVLAEKEARRITSAPAEPSPRGPGSEPAAVTPKVRVAKQRQRSQVAATPLACRRLPRSGS